MNARTCISRPVRSRRPVTRTRRSDVSSLPVGIRRGGTGLDHHHRMGGGGQEVGLAQIPVTVRISAVDAADLQLDRADSTRPSSSRTAVPDRTGMVPDALRSNSSRARIRAVDSSGGIIQVPATAAAPAVQCPASSPAPCRTSGSRYSSTRGRHGQRGRVLPAAAPSLISRIALSRLRNGAPHASPTSNDPAEQRFPSASVRSVGIEAGAEVPHHGELQLTLAAAAPPSPPSSGSAVLSRTCPAGRPRWIKRRGLSYPCARVGT
jgi:hypothetical protein